jgi:hypothetical protein
VKHWFYNNGRQRTDKNKVNYTKHWSMKKAEVQEACKELTNSNPGTREYIVGYQKALSRVVKDLNEDEETEYQKLVMEWNKRSPPAEIQRK